jgi:serine/threonine protein kinase
MDAATYEKYRQKFIEDAQTLTRFDHTGVVKATDVFAENNTAYMVTPCVEGTSLQKTVEQYGALSYDTAANYIAQLSEAVSYIHSKNMLHSNINPDSIIITSDDRVVLINFGSTHEFVSEKTQDRSFTLTQSYASPEQYQSSGSKGTWSDVYSLGAVCYFALTGQKPVSAVTRFIETMPEPQTLVPSIPAAANRAIMKAMQLKPENRHQTVQDFMINLSDNTAKARSLWKTMQTNASSSGKTGKQKTNVSGWIFAVVVVIFGIAAVYMVKQKTQLNVALSDNETLTTQLADANRMLNAITEVSPVIISDIKVGVMKGDGTVVVEPGEAIFSLQTRYLCPSITGISLIPVSKNIHIKLYNAYGILARGNTSPNNYTYTYELNTPSGSFQNIKMGGWGSDTSGFWASGQYRFEIWCDGKCIGLKDFIIFRE